MEDNKAAKKQDKGISQILPEEKRAWPGIAFIWIGTMICIPMLMVGGIFASALTVPSILLVTVVGFAVCCLLMTLGGIVGSDLGLNSTMTLHTLSCTSCSVILRWQDRET